MELNFFPLFFSFFFFLFFFFLNILLKRFQAGLQAGIIDFGVATSVRLILNMKKCKRRTDLLNRLQLVLLFFLFLFSLRFQPHFMLRWADLNYTQKDTNVISMIIIIWRRCPL